MSLGATTHARMTLEQWADLPKDVEGELVDGYLVEEEQVTFRHSIVAMWLAEVLGPWGARSGAAVGLENVKLKITPRRGRKPDLFMYLRDQPRPSLDAPLISAMPSVVVEIISKECSDARRDRIDKMDEYATAGIPWYWLVDPQLRLFEIYELGADGRFARALGAAEGKLDAIPGCPDLVLDLDALWARIDGYDDSFGTG